jgi:hypothetical protein
VLKGQSIRSNAGLYYDGETEFVETLRTLERHRWLSGTLGRNGRQYFREHYDWPVVERKYLDMLERLSKEPPAARMEPIPGWLSRRRRDCRPGRDVAAALPKGPVLSGEPRTYSRPVEPRPAAAPAIHDRRGPQGRGPRPQYRGRRPRAGGA